MDYIYSLFLISLIWAIVVKADEPLEHQCSPTGLDPSPIFQTNLYLIMRKFQNNLPSLHYVQDQTVGPGKDNVYAYILCRGDTTIAECKSCVFTAVTELVKKCGTKREGGIWYDKCMIKFADRRFFGEIDHRDDFYRWLNPPVKNVDELNDKSKGLLARLVPTCTKAPNRFARGTAPFGAKTIYGMVQCSRDLTPANCKKCLDFQIDDIGRACCGGMPGGRVVGTSCNIRYELQPFLRN